MYLATVAISFTTEEGGEADRLTEDITNLLVERMGYHGFTEEEFTILGAMTQLEDDDGS